MSKRILFICLSKGENETSPLGGMEKHIAQLVTGLSNDAHYTIGLASAANLCSAIGEQHNIQCYQLDTHKARRSRELQQAVQLAIETFSPDIIHCHGLKSAYVVQKLYQSRTVHAQTVHAQIIATMHGFKKKQKQLAAFDYLIAVSQDIYTELTSFCPRTVLIENGVDTCAHSSEQALSKLHICDAYALNPEWPLALAVGRLAKVKNYDILMQAFSSLNANLLVVGDGPEYKTLNALQTKNVKLTGYRSDARMLMPSADLLIINSTREGFSLSMIEALHAETPVLSTPVSGVNGLLPEGSLLKHTNDPRKLQQQLAEKLTKIDQLKASHKAAFSYAKQHLSTESMLKKTKQLYQSIANENPTLLFLGDCNTCGTDALNASGEQTYPSIVSNALAEPLKNCGQTMSTTREALNYFDDYRNADLKIVFIQYGLVDSWQTIKAAPYVLYYPDSPVRRFLRRWVKKWKKYGRKFGLGRLFGMQHQVPLAEYTQNIERIIQACDQQNTQVVLIETAPNHDRSRNPAIKAYNAALQTLAEQNSHCELVKVYDAFEQSMDAYYIDPTHFSAAGHATLAERVLQGLKK